MEPSPCCEEILPVSIDDPQAFAGVNGLHVIVLPQRRRSIVLAQEHQPLASLDVNVRRLVLTWRRIDVDPRLRRRNEGLESGGAQRRPERLGTAGAVGGGRVPSATLVRQMKCFRYLPTLALVLGAPGFVVPSGDLSAQGWFAGVSLHEARIATPFLHPSTCGPYSPVLGRSAVRGPSAHLGREFASGFEVRLQVSNGTEVDSRGCPDHPPPGDRVARTITLYPGEVGGSRARSADLTLAYSLRVVPLRAGATVGWLKGARTPYFALGLGFRSRTAVRVFADLGLRFQGARYVEFRGEWEDSQLVSSEEIGRGREWISGREWRFGLELPFR